MFPKISCICVTQNKREPLLRAMECFIAQSYPNKELVILYEDGDQIAQSAIERYQNLEEIVIHIEPSDPKKTLGELRNIAIKKSNGEFFCQWDDDDWYSAYRLDIQFSNLGNYQSNILDQWFVFDSYSEQAYISNKHIWEGSILCNKKEFQNGINYIPITRGEDTHVVEQLYLSNKIQKIHYPYLYVYVYDGKNTWDRQHWENIFKVSFPLSKWHSKDIQAILNGHYGIEEASYRLKQLYMSLDEKDLKV